jgi:L-threonylcarbamoyladenylate synthase
MNSDRWLKRGCTRQLTTASAYASRYHEDMETEVLRVDAGEPDKVAIARAADVIRAGGLVAFPTETVYGLGANALDPDAVSRIFTAKDRPATNPLIVHVTGADAALGLVTQWPNAASRLAARFWPGPLTLVLPKRSHIPDVATGGGPTVAVRAPAHPVAMALLLAAGVPVAAPSANRSTRVSPTRAEHVLRDLGGRIALLIDAGPTPGGIESTVLDLASDVPRLLRPGLVTPAEIEAVIGPIARGPASSTGIPRSPGTLRRHYAPRAMLECVAGDGVARATTLATAGTRVALLALGEIDTIATEGVAVVTMPPNPDAYAARLYAVLHGVDEARMERVVVAMPPDDDAWLAVRDRLLRAATRP